jgi:hypothetical protein
MEVFMKAVFSIVLSFVVICTLSFLGFAQNPIPNPGFENWTGTEPDGWLTNNVPGFAQPVQQSSTSHSGSSSAKAEVVSYFGSPWPAWLWAGDNGYGFPVSQRHASLTGYYQFHQMAGDALYISATMYKDGAGFGAGTFFTGVQASSWTPFSIDIFYLTGEVPDTAWIFIEVFDTTGNATISGSYALVDDLAFMGISDIRQVENSNLAQVYQLKQNYPNPFNPTTNIEFSIPKSSDVKLVIYNQLGQAVATLVDKTLSPGSYSVDWNAEGLPSGVYFYRITAGDFTQTRKLLLTK